MLIKEAVYKEVQVTQKELVEHEVHGCDHCTSEIKEYPNEDSRLEITVFYHNHDKESEHLHFCSWECALAHLAEIETDYFISLPYLYFDAPKGSKRSARHLIDVLRKSGLAK